MGRDKKLLPIFVREQEFHLIISDIQDADFEKMTGSLNLNKVFFLSFFRSRPYQKKT